MKVKSIVKVVICIVILFIFFNNLVIVRATDKFMQGADDFLSKGTKELFNLNSMKETSNLIFSTFGMIGMAAVLIVGVILGIKFIMSSVDEKAKIKETLMTYIISSIVIFGAFGIWSICVKVFQNIF